MIRRHTRNVFLTGLVALLPTALTIILLVKAYQLVADTIGSSITWFLVQVIALALRRERDAIAPYVPSAAGVVIAIVLVFLLGLVLASLIGRRTWNYVEARLVGMPIVRLIYPSVKQVTDFFFKEKKIDFKGVVLVEYPRKNMWAMGFVTGKAFATLSAHEGREMISVFVPSSPTPFTGMSLQLPRDEVIELNVSVDAALRYVVSGGVIPPEAEVTPEAVEAVIQTA